MLKLNMNYVPKYGYGPFSLKITYPFPHTDLSLVLVSGIIAHGDYNAHFCHKTNSIKLAVIGKEYVGKKVAEFNFYVGACLHAASYSAESKRSFIYRHRSLNDDGADLLMRGCDRLVAGDRYYDDVGYCHKVPLDFVGKTVWDYAEHMSVSGNDMIIFRRICIACGSQGRIYTPHPYHGTPLPLP